MTEPTASPEDASSPWGAQTELALRHFAIGEERMPVEWIQALLALKGAAAAVNGRLGQLDKTLAEAIDGACAELLERGDAMQDFPLSMWQSGSGTQSHMNVNEVVARRAERRLRDAGRDARVHPNDDVNRGQSSNDMVPSAMHVAIVVAAQTRLLPAIDVLSATLRAQADRHLSLVKLGRTHLQDAVPMTLGQEIGAWQSQLLAGRRALKDALPALHELAVGGSAVGTGLNTHPLFGADVCEELSRRLGFAFSPAADRFAALAGHEPVVAFHGALKTLAVALAKIANDVRLLACGPRAGFAELRLPANEPGSSIMPGKVNPTQCEALVMVCHQVIGNDLAVTLGAAAGQLQLNTCKPLILHNTLRSLRLLTDAQNSFERHAMRELAADETRIAALLQRSLMLVTALNPHIGYDRAARIAKRAHAEGTTLREAGVAEGLDAGDLDRWLDPAAMLGPRG
ncbi:MAG TPA: class II fumarate hydratase [Methylibium sp.]|uniref:class II fumarate hydratase n=1 Tax=Methylibium sp. TaxID=2067992 RepID=UPI002DBE0225|nr:class II fumarate hydratase [Methylibium sp.]HEU4459084.1 class II fumarate hydratase [Methylibium sp.]